MLSVGFWIGSLAVALGFSLLLGLNLVLAPAAVFIGMSVGAAARKLNCFTCPRCESELIDPESVEDMLPLRRWRRSARFAPATAQT